MSQPLPEEKHHKDELHEGRHKEESSKEDHEEEHNECRKDTHYKEHPTYTPYLLSTPWPIFLTMGSLLERNSQP